MSWLELDQVILALSLIMGGNAIYNLALWLLPPVVVMSVVTLGCLTTIAWVLTK